MLETYGKKRDFDRTPEPPPAPGGAGGGPLTFVVHKHAARRLHYDLRLELDGVLVSWAIPKGPSLDPAQKRLAAKVEDHPFDYGSFEGVIPKGAYGAGETIVWDRGTYTPDEGGALSWRDRDEAQRRVHEGIASGKLSVFFRGEKLRGSFALVKTSRDPKDWLLIKHKDRYVDTERDILDEQASVLSGLTIDDLKAGQRPETAKSTVSAAPGGLPGARAARFPASVAPMQASIAERPFSHPDWLFEPKLDGIRAIALIRDGTVRLLSRSGLDATKQYPALVAELAAQPERRLVLDGEIVALDEEGRPSFQRLQQRLNLTRATGIRQADRDVPALYYVFDLLYAGEHDLRAAPLESRKALLRRLLLPTDSVRALDHIDEEGTAAYEAAVEHGLEGVVAKRRNSVYEPGKRARTWLKVKSTFSDDFVVAGYTAGSGARAATFGALLLGEYGEYGDDGRLTYAGHAGSGFDDRTLADVRSQLDALRSDTCPFDPPPAVNAPATWVRPELVAEVKFAQRTQDGSLRAPVFVRLRPDKPPKDAVRAKAAVRPPDAPPREPSQDAPVAQQAEAVLAQLRGTENDKRVEVEGHRLGLTNLTKEMWPPLSLADGERRALTKRDLILYLAKVAPYLLPHLRDRPLTLTRYPNGIAGGHFYQRHWEHKLPPFVETVRLYSEHIGGDTEHMMCNNLATLIWLGQIADLELHTWYSRVRREPDALHASTNFAGSEESIDGSALNYPDFLVFDLDPYIYSGREKGKEEPELNRRAFAATCEVALRLKEVLDSLSLPAFVKTSGRTGLHIYVPIIRQYDYDAVRAVADTIGRFVVRERPREVTMDWAVEKRRGMVFLDHNQNARSKTLASVYSPRVLPEAAVSMPLRWDEVGRMYPTDFTILTAPDRLRDIGDLWAGILDAKHDLGALLEATGGGS